MKELIERGIDFVKKNPAIFYSLFLVVAVTGVMFLNTFYAINRFQDNSDKLLHRQAVIAEDIFQVLASEYIDDSEKIQSKIKKLQETNGYVNKIRIMIPSEKTLGSFKVIASTDEKELGAEIEDTLAMMAWNFDPGYASNEFDGRERYWNVTKVLKNNEGGNRAVVSFKLSLLANDEMIENTVSRVYLFSLVALFIVLLIIANNVKLLGYAVKVAKLQEVDKMKDDFISMASHELRSPLVALQGYVELVSDEARKAKINPDSSREINHYLGNMKDSVLRLNELVNDLLEVSRLEQNRLPITIQETEVTGLLKKTVGEMAPMAKEKKLELCLEPMNVFLADADPERIKQIVVNLISNAIKYTPQGKVTISGREDRKFVYITIADTGLGISADNLKNLFNKFYRIRNEKTAGISGTGLGLWISREIARKMEGDVIAESIEGMGSHLILKLKRSKK